MEDAWLVARDRARVLLCDRRRRREETVGSKSDGLWTGVLGWVGRRRRECGWLVLFLLWVAWPAAGQTAEPTAPVVSAAGEVYVGPGQAARRAAAARATLRSALHPTVVELPPVGKAEGQRAARTDGGDRPEPEPERLGFGRDVPAHLALDESRLVWVSLPDGGRAATLAVRSPGAAALRARFDFSVAPTDLELRFYNPLDRAGAVGPVGPAELLADRPEGGTHGLYWSPTVDGDTLAVEFHMPGPGKLSFSLVVVSHLEVSPLSVEHLGNAASCTIDLACRPDDISGISARSVAKYVFTSAGGRSSGCTGQLISDLHPESQTPYLLTARHCVGDQTVASSTEFYWRFERAGCGEEGLHADYERTPGGAFLLAGETHRSGTDYALLRMKQAPPTHVGMAGWTTATAEPGTPVVGVSHPRLDVKKISLGDVTGHDSWVYDDPNATHVVLRVSAGAVQGGSSGSGLWTRTEGGDYLVGVLTGGTRGCSQRLWYGRLDRFYAKLRPWLGSVAPIRFALLDAASGAELLELVPDATIDLSSTEADSFNILAQLIGGDPVGTMALELAGPQSASGSSSAPPYTLYGEGGGGGLPPGSYTVTARTVPEGTAAGANERSVAFTVTGDAEEDDFRLVGLTVTTTGGRRVASLTADAVVDLAQHAADAQYDIRAESAGTAPVGSVSFELSGAGEASAIDSTAPFALRGPLSPGSYRITATPHPEAAAGGTAGTALAVDFMVARESPVTGFTLVNARGGAPDEDVTAIADGATLDLSPFEQNWFTIRADVGDMASVGSVQLELTGPRSVSRTENGPPPFALNGDNGEGNYYGMQLANGDYRIRATAHTRPDANGAALASIEVSFSVTGGYDPDVSPLTGFTLVHAAGGAPDEDVTAIADGATLDVSSYGKNWFNIRADATGRTAHSVRLELTGPVTAGRTENGPPPFALKGDDGEGDYYGMKLANGDYTITATAHTRRDLNGAALPALEVSFSVTGAEAEPNPLTGFTLVHAAGGAPDPDVSEIAEGATLDISSFEKNWFNIRANVASGRGVRSVRLELDGPVSGTRTENAPPPYALKGDNGEGDYYGMKLANGDYTITATAYAGRGGSGDALESLAIGFSVTGGAEPEPSPVTGFTLVDATGDPPDPDLTAIADGATLDLSSYTTDGFNIRADVAAAPVIGSVRLELVGPVSLSRTENAPAPYTVRGDNGDNYWSMTLPNGDYTITATAYTGQDRSGNALPAVAVDFTVTGSYDPSASPVAGFALVNATGDAPDEDVSAITDGATLDLSSVDGNWFSIRAEIDAGRGVESVRLELGGPVSRTRTENAPPPYALTGDDEAGDYFEMPLPNGDYRIRAVPYAQQWGRGDAMAASEIGFTVTGSYDADANPLTGFTLVDAHGEAPDDDVAAIADGATLDISSYEQNWFTIRADTGPAASTVGSVWLELEGPVSRALGDNAAPYALNGDNGAGDYFGLRLANGDYRVMATAYGRDDLLGETRGSATVAFTVAGGFDASDVPLIGFTLVNAGTDEDAAAVADGATLDVAELGGSTTKFTFRADRAENAAVGSVLLELTGPVVQRAVQREATPYSLHGVSDGDYGGTYLANGDYRLTATPYSGRNLSGNPLPVLEAAFTVTGSYDPNASPVIGFTLVDPTGDPPDPDITAIADGATLDLSSYATHRFNIRADVAALPPIGSMLLELAGPVSVTRTENAPAPYALKGNDGDDYWSMTLPNGDYTITATAYRGRDRSGDTLPAVAVDFTVTGSYDVDTSPLTGFTLVHAAGGAPDEDLTAIADGATLDISSYGQNWFSIRADVSDGRTARSVRLELTGPVTAARTENDLPFALKGDDGEGDYYGVKLANGDYRVTATAHTRPNANGEALPSLEASFSVTGGYDPDVSPLTGFTLVHAAGGTPDPDVSEIAEGAMLDISSFEKNWFNIRANVASGRGVRSVRLELDGPVSGTRTENAPPPYALKGDNGEGDYYGMKLANGDYTITATAYAGRGGSGDALESLAIGFSVTGGAEPEPSPVTGFTLVDATGDPPDPDLTAIADGATLALSSYATRQFNIRADVAADAPIGSIYMHLRGPVPSMGRERVEDAPAPYTVMGDVGDDYLWMELPPGDYRMTAEPYTGNRLTGQALPTLEVHFSITD